MDLFAEIESESTTSDYGTQTAAQLHTPEDCTFLSNEGGDWAASRLQQMMYNGEEIMKEGHRKAAENEMRNKLHEATLSGETPTVVANTGATAMCLKPANTQPTQSECSKYTWDGQPFKNTGRDSTKIFQMALGNVGKGEHSVQLNLTLRPKATTGYTVQGLQHNLLSVNMLTK